MKKKAGVKASPEMLKRIENLGGKKRTPKQLAKMLNVSPAAISAWRLGRFKLSSDTLIKLANWAIGTDILWFLEKAGVDIRKLFSVAQWIALASLPEAKSDELVFVPSLTVPKESETQRLSGFPVPRRFVRGLKDVACLVVGKRSAGYGLAPGDVLILDASPPQPGEGLMSIWGQRVVVEIDFSVLYPGLKTESGMPKQFLVGRIVLSDGVTPSPNKICYSALFRVLADDMLVMEGGERTIMAPAPLVVGEWTGDTQTKTDSARGYSWGDLPYERALLEMRLNPGVRVLGKLIAWFHPPQDTNTKPGTRR
jgi:transcriptional regulator with XRE-family HTH domain